MNNKELGKSGLEVSALGLGCMVVSAPQMISEAGALSANVKVMAEEPLEWSRF